MIRNDLKENELRIIVEDIHGNQQEIAIINREMLSRAKSWLNKFGHYLGDKL